MHELVGSISTTHVKTPNSVGLGDEPHLGYGNKAGHQHAPRANLHTYHN